MRAGPASGARRRTIAAAVAPISDTFATFDDATNWPGSYGTPYPSVVSGRLRLICNSGYPTALTGAVFDVTQYAVFIQVPTVPAAGAGGTQTQFFLSNAGGSGGFEITGAPLTLQTKGTGLANTSVTYSSTSHQWLRMSVSGGNLLFDTSPDKVTWTNMRTVAAPSWVTSALNKVQLSCGYYGTETAPGYAEYDNFNA